MVARPWRSSRLSCGEPLLLRCDLNAGNSFPTTQEKDPSSRARRRKRCSSGSGRDSRASTRVETGMSGNFLSCSQGVKNPLEVPDVRCDWPGDASAEMGLIAPGGESLLGKPQGKATDPLIHAKGSVTLLLELGRKAHVHAPTRDEDRLHWGDSRSTPRSLSALERNAQVPAPTLHKILGPGIHGRGILRGPRATRMGTGLS